MLRIPSVEKDSSRSMRSSGKISPIAWMLAILIGCFISYTAFEIHQIRQTLLGEEVQKLTGLANSYATTVSILLHGYNDKARLVATSAQLKKLLNQYNSQPSENLRQSMSAILTDAAKGDPDIDRISIVDFNIQVVAANQPDMSGGIDKGYSDIMGNVPDEFEATQVQMLRTGNQIFLVVSTPLLLNQHTIGLLQVRLNPQAINRSIKSAQFGATGEVLLVAADAAGNALSVTEVRNRSHAIGQQIATSSGSNVPMIYALNHGTGVLLDEAVDYSGRPVIAATRKIEGINWGIVVKKERTEVFKNINKIVIPRTITSVFLICIAIALIIVVARKMDVSRLCLQKALDTRKQADRRFMEVFEVSSAALMIVGADGFITQANEKSTQLLGYAADKLVGMSVESLVPEKLRDRHTRLRDDYNHTPHIRTMKQGNNLQALCGDGKTITMAIDLRPIETEEGASVLVTMMDKTAELEAQRRITEHAEALSRSNEELDKFAYLASHDLKAPLRGIGQLASIIEEDTRDFMSEESKTDLAMLRNRVFRMEHLLDSLLQYCRVGRGESHMHQIELEPLVREVAALFIPNDRFELVINGKLPVVVAPPTALDIVLRNLIMNAIKHHHQDEGIIRVEATCDDKRVCLIVSDDGPGIPEEHAEKVFMMFQTLKRRDEIEGSGMGLALVKKVMESFGGIIELVPGVSVGASFRLQWPIYPDVDVTE